MNRHHPYAYRRDALKRLPTELAGRIGELLPHRWSAPTREPLITTASRGQDGIAVRLVRQETVGE